MSDRPVVLDASALLALLRREKGADAVLAVLPGATMSTVNLAEVASKLADYGMAADAVAQVLDEIDLDLHAFDAAAAHVVGELRGATRECGLSLGDRACLGLARALGAVALTADQTWAGLELPGIAVELIR